MAMRICVSTDPPEPDVSPLLLSDVFGPELLLVAGGTSSPARSFSSMGR